ERKDRALPAAQGAHGRTRLVRRWREIRGVDLIDVGRADIVVDIGALVDLAMEGAGAHGELVADTAGLEAAVEHGAQLVILAGVVGAAEIIDVVVAVWREEVAGRAVGTGRGVEAAIGKGDVVVDHAMAVAGRELRVPVRAQAMLQAQGGVAGVDAHRLLPRLEAEHARAAGVRWDGGATEQLVAGDRALAAGLVVGV